jgi:two-component system sensor histidine kinase VanS
MSARLRLTLSYAAFLLVAAGAMFALILYVLHFVPVSTGIDRFPGFLPGRDDLFRAVWPRLWQVAGVLLVIGLVGGWFLSGRMLRPLKRINAVAQRVAAGALDDRVRLTGPHDEFHQLADTFDSMLDRLQHAFEEQRRFTANASHELRTPYAISRSMIDVAQADPDGVDLPKLLRRLDETNRRGADTVAALLTLASLDYAQGVLDEPVDVADLAADVIDELAPLAAAAGIEVSSTLGEGDIDGRTALVRQLIANLVLNGIRHNAPGGTVDVTTRSHDSGAVELTVLNTGPVVPPELVGTLTEPFVRGAGRVAPGSARPAGEGSGLGLALVARIAEVHGAVLWLVPRQQGGLTVRVTFPPPRAAR